MTATVKEFYRINDIDENAENLASVLYYALTGGIYGDIGEDRAEGKEVKASIPNGATRTADS